MVGQVQIKPIVHIMIRETIIILRRATGHSVATLVLVYHLVPEVDGVPAETLIITLVITIAGKVQLTVPAVAQLQVAL